MSESVSESETNNGFTYAKGAVQKERTALIIFKDKRFVLC